MKGSTIKVTYSLDPLSASEIEALAKAWQVPKSEVIRRSVHAAASRQDQIGPRRLTREQALKQLQASPRLSASQVNRWLRDIREERASR